MHKWVVPPKKRYEHIHVRFAPAIHGLRDFWEGPPTRATICGVVFAKVQRTPGLVVWFRPCAELEELGWLGLPKNVEGQGWPERSAHGCARSGFLEAQANPATPKTNRLGPKNAPHHQSEPNVTRLNISNQLWSDLGIARRFRKPDVNFVIRAVQ